MSNLYFRLFLFNMEKGLANKEKPDRDVQEALWDLAENNIGNYRKLRKEVRSVTNTNSQESNPGKPKSDDKKGYAYPPPEYTKYKNINKPIFR